MGSAALEAGNRIGDYELIRLLGRGGMGDVWLALEIPTDRRVAMKFIKPHLLAEPTFLTRFLNEAKTLGRLEHDRIVRLHRVLQTDGLLALILGFIDGKSLSDQIEQEAPLSIEAVLRCCRDVLPALGLAHQRGIVHRDIKPQNILVDAEGRSFVSDFGIAVVDFAERGTATGFSIGTPHYMSPEQIQNPQKLSPQEGGHRSDIYSFGVVLFEMLTGRLPFGEHGKPEESFQVQTMHCIAPPPRLRDFNPAVPPAVEELVLLCMDKSPDNRPQSCKELLEMLEKAATGVAPAVAVRRVAATVFEAAPNIPAHAAAAHAGGTAPFRSGTGTPSGGPAAVVAAPKNAGMPKMAWVAVGVLLAAGGVGYAIFTQAKPAVAQETKSETKDPGTGEVPKNTPPATSERVAQPIPQRTTDPPPGPGLPPGSGQQQPIVTGLAPSGPSASAGQVAGEAQQLMAAGKPCEAESRAQRAADLDPRNRPLLERASSACTDVRMAEADANRAEALFTAGEYCQAQTKMNLARTKHPTPQYTQKLAEFKKACDDSLR